MPGASEFARRVKTVNANWVSGADGDDGQFKLLLITDDGQRHVLMPSPAAMATIVALTQADTVVAFDPADSTLIVANIVGTMPWTER